MLSTMMFEKNGIMLPKSSNEFKDFKFEDFFFIVYDGKDYIFKEVKHLSRVKKMLTENYNHFDDMTLDEIKLLLDWHINWHSLTIPKIALCRKIDKDEICLYRIT